MKEIKEMNIFKKYQIMIFDMDGTLYEHDGAGGTFKNSSLQRAVIGNSIKFVVNKEGCEFSVAEELIREAQKDSIGVSNVLSKRYGITRAEVFEMTWNIDPKIVMKNFELSARVVLKLKTSGKRLFLLTGAPRVWMENVIKELSIADLFERKIYGEMFGKKDEIFETLAKEFDPKTILSVGDQFETDLKPAHDRGMGIFQVTKPEDLLKLI